MARSDKNQYAITSADKIMQNSNRGKKQIELKFQVRQRLCKMPGAGIQSPEMFLQPSAMAHAIAWLPSCGVVLASRHAALTVSLAAEGVTTFVFDDIRNPEAGCVAIDRRRFVFVHVPIGCQAR